jgi:hypothetical protein
MFIVYEGESKSKGKKHFNGINRSNCEQFYTSFFYTVPLQHNAFVQFTQGVPQFPYNNMMASFISSNSFSIWAARDVFRFKYHFG